MRVNFVQSFWRHVRHGFASVAVVATLALSPVAVHADNYGSGVYSNDVYNSSNIPSTGSGSSSSSGSSATPASSSPTAESTVIETPSGLQVAINLSNGQVIPSTGYYITITPLNGEGKSFDKAEIYLDGKLAYTSIPDGTGTVKWLWDTANNPATKVRIVVFGPGAGTTTHEFDVTVAPAGSTSTVQTPTDTNVMTATSTTDATWPLWLVLALAGGILLIVLLIIWIIVRRRRHDQLPPNTFAPMQ